MEGELSLDEALSIRKIGRYTLHTNGLPETGAASLELEVVANDSGTCGDCPDTDGDAVCDDDDTCDG